MFLFFDLQLFNKLKYPCIFQNCAILNHPMMMDAATPWMHGCSYNSSTAPGFQKNMLSVLLFRMLIMYFLVLQIPTKQSSSNQIEFCWENPLLLGSFWKILKTFFNLLQERKECCEITEIVFVLYQGDQPIQKHLSPLLPDSSLVAFFKKIIENIASFYMATY